MISLTRSGEEYVPMLPAAPVDFRERSEALAALVKKELNMPKV